MSASPGTVYWITGLSGAGKTTLARAVVTELRARGRFAVLLDGDELRAILGRETGGFDPASRSELAHVYARLARALAAQGADAVCATISMFRAVRDWNRANNPAYVEIYLDVPLDERARRDPKGLYARGDGAMAGLDSAAETPETPDLVFGAGVAPPDAVARILAFARAKNLA
jgi:cytidine diphosphoramidate kinase